MNQETTCATCTNWRPRESGRMGPLRLAICARGPVWKFYPPQSTCDKHNPASADVVDARKRWLTQ